MRDTPRTSILDFNPSNDLRRGLRLLREPIDQHIHLPSEPDRPSRDPLGLRAPCSRSSCRGSFLAIIPGKEQAVLVECLCFFVWRIFQYTRYRMGLVHTSIRLARRTNCCFLSAEISTANNLTHLGPLSDISRSTAFHYCCTSSSFNHHHFCRGTNYSAA